MSRIAVSSISTRLRATFTNSWFIALLTFVLISVYMNRDLLGRGVPAPDFRLTDLAGKEVRLEDYAGKSLALYFWASWCGVCKTNLPLLNWEYGDYESDDFAFVTVLTDAEHLHKIRPWIRENEIRMPVLLAGSKVAERLIEDYKVTRFPTTYFVSDEGKIVTSDSGLLTPMGIWLRRLLVGVIGLF